MDNYNKFLCKLIQEYFIIDENKNQICKIPKGEGEVKKQCNYKYEHL